MKRRTFIASAGALAGLDLIPFAACAQAKRTLFRWVPANDLTLLDPTFTTATITACHAMQVFDNLFGSDSSYTTKPQMVSEYSIDPAGLVWDLHLRPGLKFHDDSPVRTQDVIASIKRYGKSNPLGQTFMGLVTELSAPDPQTVRITLSKPFPLVAYALSGPASSIMPERIISASDGVAIKEIVGSGPFKFIASKWVSGSQVVYEKFEAYVPRADGQSSNTAGPKVAHIQDLKWQIINDRATAVAALQNNEVDGIETVDNDFIPVLSKDPSIRLIKGSVPSIPLMRFNHLQAPFNNVLMRRAILAVVRQNDYMTAANGADFPEYWSDKVGVFAPGTPMANDAGLEKLTGKRDFDLARKLIKESGYNGQAIVLLDPVDSPTHHASALITADLFKKLGLKIDVRSMDWGSYLQTRNNQDAPEAGGWNVAFTAMVGTSNLDPASNLGIRGTGKQAWFGWPTNQKIEDLRTQWFYAKDLAERQELCRQIQLQVFEEVPYIPLGAIYNLMAVRKEWLDFQPEGPVFYTTHKA